MADSNRHAFHPGDAIIFEREDGTWDVYTIAASCKVEPYRGGLKTEGAAYEIARAALSGGRIWLCCYIAPERFEPYRIH